MYRLLLPLMIFSIHCHGEPGKITSFLMSDSPSMIDFALHKIEQYYETGDMEGSLSKTLIEKYPTGTFTGLQPGVTIDIGYDWRDDKIYIDYVVTYGGTIEPRMNMSDELASSLCKSTWSLANVGNIYYLSPDTNDNREKTFGHSGFARENQPENFGEEIRAIMGQRVFVNATNGARRAECTGEYGDRNPAVRLIPISR